MWLSGVKTNSCPTRVEIGMVPCNWRDLLERFNPWLSSVLFVRKQLAQDGGVIVDNTVGNQAALFWGIASKEGNCREEGRSDFLLILQREFGKISMVRFHKVLVKVIESLFPRLVR